MNSFRIKDIKFRILKGGKIGLAMAIGLISSMSLQAQDFFDGFTTTTNTHTYAGGTYTTGSSGPLPSTSVTFSSVVVPFDTITGAATSAVYNNTNDSILFKETYSGTSTTGLTLFRTGLQYDGFGYITYQAGTYDAARFLSSGSVTVTGTPNPSKIGFKYVDFLKDTTNIQATVSDVYTVTMNSNATATTISKEVGAIYKANLILSGDNTISGATNISNGDIKLDGNGTFSGAVTAGSINVNTTAQSIFNSSIDLDNDPLTSNKITYSNSGVVLAKNGLQGGIDFGSSNGTFTLDSGNISGNIDGSGNLNLNNTGISTLGGNIGSTTAVTNVNIYNTGISNVNDINATNITYNNKGTLNVNGTLTTTNGVNFQANDGTLKLSNGDVNFAINNTSNGNGTVILAGATQTISNAIGTSTNKIKLLQIGDSTATATTTVNADINALDTKIFGNSEIILNTNKSITSNITSNANGNGKLTLLGGTQTLSNDIGTAAIKLDTINAATDGATSNFNGNTYAKNISLGAGIANFTGTTLADVVFADAGTANFNSGLTGSINFAGKDAIANIIGAANITNGVTTTTNNTGTVTFDSPVNVGFNLGTAGNGLKLVSFADNTSISSNIYADEIKMNASNKTITVSDTFNVYDTNKTNSVGIVTTTNNQGVLTLAGTSTVDAVVGSSSARFNQINAGATDKTATFNELIYAENLNFSGNGSVELGGINTNDTTNSVIVDKIDFAGGTGTLALKSGVNITRSASATSFLNNSNANLKFLGNSTVTGAIGESSDKFNTIYAGANSSIVDFKGSVTTANLDYIGNGTVKIDGTLSNEQANTSVDFKTFDGKLEISNADLNADLTHENGKATVLMANGMQSINGEISTLTSYLKKLEIANDSTTTSNVDIHALNTMLGLTSTSNNAQLTLANDKNITSAVSTSANNTGKLIFAGGTQTASGNIGTSSVKLNEINLAKTATDISNINGDANSINIYVGDGTANFVKAVNANTTTIGSGTANFNTDENSIATSTLSFTANNAIANLYTGIIGNIDFTNHNAIVNNWDGKTLQGDIKSTGGVNSSINMKGAGSIIGNIGTGILDGIVDLNLNTQGTSAKTVNVSGNIYAKNVNFTNGAILNLSANKVMTGINATPISGNEQFISTDVNNTGKLILAGDNTITGVVGSSDKILNAIEAGSLGTDTFNNMVYVDTLKFNGNGKVVLNAQNGISAQNAGLKGTVDLNNTTGQLQIGENVNLTTGTSGIEFANASTAKLKFNGNSTITGILGGDTQGKSTFEKIYAGVDGKTVTFKDDVYVKESSITPATFHVSGTGIVNFEGNLNGDVNYDADGTINVSNKKSIIITQAPISVKTSNSGTGTLNYLGSTTLANSDIGKSSKLLKAVNFNTDNNNIHQVIDQNIYALDTNIGNTTNGVNAINFFDTIGTYDYAGASIMKEFRGGTSANFIGNKTIGGNLNLANATTAINIGTSHLNILDTLNTNNAAISFTVNTKDITGTDSASSTSDDSGYITTKNLTVSGDEKIRVNYVGSLSNNGTYTLIDVDDTNGITTGTYSKNEIDNPTLVSDNSFSIDTKVYLNGKNLVILADRTGSGTSQAKDLYVEKSKTTGHFSNNAAKVLAGISGNGKQYGDMIEVIQKLEIDSFGYGDTKEKLSTQVKKLAPIVNNSLAQTSINSSALIGDTISNRISDIRGLSSGDETLDNSAWAKVITSKGTQSSVDMYDGYETKANGLSFGYDKSINDDLVIGVSLGLVQSDTTQTDFRSGDTSDTSSYQASIYASKTFDKLYVDGILSYGMNSTSGKRATAVGRTALYDVDSSQYGLKLETGYDFKYNDVKITPFASVNYNILSQDPYKETEAGALNLSVDAVEMSRGSVGVGVKTSTDVVILDKTITPELRVGYNKYFGDTQVETIAKFEQGDSFITPSAQMMKSTYTIGTGVKTNATDNLTLSLDTDYKTSDNGYDSIDLKMAIRYKF